MLSLPLPISEKCRGRHFPIRDLPAPSTQTTPADATKAKVIANPIFHRVEKVPGTRWGSQDRSCLIRLRGLCTPASGDPLPRPDAE
jgi:hypothetical protein